MTKSIIQNKTKIGIIGLGAMGGERIAKKFIKKGYQVFVCDLNKDIIKKFQDKGAIACSTPKELAEKSNFVFEVTPNDESSKLVWAGKEGILSGASPDTILIACSTLSASWVDELANKCNEAGFQFFDMAMTGGDRGLTLLCGGNKEKLPEIKPVLRAFAGKIIYLGPQGHGMRYKLILNFLQAVHVIGLRQAMKMARDNHMNVKKVGNELVKKPGGVVTEISWDIYQEPPEQAVFTMEMITKDLNYAKKLVDKLDISLLDAVVDEYKKAIKDGHGKKGWMNIVMLDN